MRTFVKMTKLGNVAGRANYITNPDKQEEIVVASESVDWKPYQQYERENQRSMKANNEGRELIIAIPNEWYDTLSREQLSQRVNNIVVLALGKKTDMQWAVHWNHDRTNLHVHVVFSERTREDKGTWDRDVYLTSEGKVARKAADRARDQSGNVLPPVHRKGELKGGFSAKDKKYTSRGWLEETKSLVKDILEQQYRVKLDAPQPLHEFHEGKGSESAAIKQKNEAIRLSNHIFETVRKEFRVTADSLRKAMVNAVKEGKIAFPARRENGLGVVRVTPEQFYFANKTPQERLKELKEAQERVFREAFAIHDNRPPIPADFGAKQRELKEAIEGYDQAKVDYDAKAASINAAMSKLHFWNGKQKKQLRAELEAQRLELRAAAEHLHKVAEMPNEFISYSERQFLSTAQTAYNDAVIKDRKDFERFKPAGAPAGDREALKTAQERLRWLCDNLPAEERINAYMSLTRAQKELPERGEARRQAVTLLENNVRSSFAAEVSALERPKERSHRQDRGWER